jgi:hypothetical protein
MAGRKTNEERQAIIDKITESRKEGMSLTDAAASCGISDKTYYLWMRKGSKAAPKQSQPKQAKKSSFLTVSVPEDKMPFVFIMGSSADVHGIFDRLSQISRRG